VCVGIYIYRYWRNCEFIAYMDDGCKNLMSHVEICTTRLWWRWGWSDDRVGSVLNILYMYIVIDWWRWWRWWWNTLENPARKIAANDALRVGAWYTRVIHFPNDYFIPLITHPLQKFRQQNVSTDQILRPARHI